MERRLFTEKQIDLSAILAGPIPPGLLIYKNYMALGKEKQAYITLASTFIFTVSFFYGMFQIPQDIFDKIPNIVFTAFYGLLVFIFFRKYMAKDVGEALERGAKKGSNWAVAGLTVLGLVINVGLIFALAIDQPFYDGELISTEGNELYYDSDLVPIEDANKLVSQFNINGFFGPDYGNIARLQLINNEYLVTLVIDEQVWSDEEVIDQLISVKMSLEVELDIPTKLQLESISLTGKSKFKEI